MRIVQGRMLAVMLAAWALLAPAPGIALSLNLPEGAIETGQDRRSADQILLPVGPRTGTGGQGLVAEGRIDRRAWSLPDTTATPFQMLDPLLDQLDALGFEPRYACRDRDCGGFDFRLALDLLPAPAMHVDLGDFRYITARRTGSAGDEYVSLVASRSEGGGHLHLTLVTPTAATEPLRITTPVAADPAPEPTGDIAETLEATGRVVLDDLAFRPGSSELGDGPFASLAALAAWLGANPDQDLVLVGHTDNVGGLEDNTRLSELRAQAVAQALVNRFDVAEGRIAAKGVAFLAPRASNATPEGRRLNRRVEAIVANQ